MTLAAGIILPPLRGATCAWNWTNPLPSIDAFGNAISANGEVIVVADRLHTYLSTNRGVTFNLMSLTAASEPYTSFGMSDDGSKIIAGGAQGYVAFSGNTGTTWALISPIFDTFPTPPGFSGRWFVGMSGDGTKMIASDNTHAGNPNNAQGLVWTTVDSGVTWTAQTILGMNLSWGDSRVSESGNLFAVDLNVVGLGPAPLSVITSPTGSTPWTTNFITDEVAAISMAVSADGSIILVQNSQNTGSLYVSRNSGATWGSTGIASSTYAVIGMSPNGLVMAAADNNINVLWVSCDSGATWSAQTAVTSVITPVQISISADGNTIIYSDSANTGTGAWVGTRVGT